MTETKAGKMLLGHFSEIERLDSEWKSVSFPMSHPLKAIGSPECYLSSYPESGHFDPCLGVGGNWVAGVQGPEGEFSSISFCILNSANAVAINFFHCYYFLKI